MHQRIKPLDKGYLAIILQILEIGFGLCFATFMKIQNPFGVEKLRNSLDSCPTYFAGTVKNRILFW